MDTRDKIAKARAQVAINTRYGNEEEAAQARIEMNEGLFEKFLEDRYEDLKDIGKTRLHEIIDNNF